jgi:hypothetical protein
MTSFLFSPARPKKVKKETRRRERKKNENSLRPGAAAGRNFSASKRTPAYSFHPNTRTRAERTSTNTNNDG